MQQWHQDAPRFALSAPPHDVTVAPILPEGPAKVRVAGRPGHADEERRCEGLGRKNFVGGRA
eukprot:7824247-Pyramimonas_sp.AAC.1